MAADLHARFAAAQTFAREAGQLACGYFAQWSTLEKQEKGVQDLVSEADRAVEALLIRRFGEQFPGDGFLGEETGARPAGDGLWVIDPIDGTANFLHGLPYWAVSVAYVRDGRLELGITYAPLLDELYAARRGGGATCNGLSIRASGCSDLARAIISVGYSRRIPPADHAAALGRLLAGGGEYRRLGCATLSLALVADGRLDGFYGPHLNSWDALAGVLLAEEAGAWASDFLAGDGLWQGKALLTCAPGLRRELEALLPLA